MSSFLLEKTIDIVLYVDRLDTYRVDNLDKMVIRAITDSFGKEIWKRALIVLTHAQFSPPDGLPYDEFVSRRSEALLNAVHEGARLKKDGILVYLAYFQPQIDSFVLLKLRVLHQFKLSLFCNLYHMFGISCIILLNSIVCT